MNMASIHSAIKFPGLKALFMTIVLSSFSSLFLFHFNSNVSTSLFLENNDNDKNDKNALASRNRRLRVRSRTPPCVGHPATVTSPEVGGPNAEEEQLSRRTFG